MSMADCKKLCEDFTEALLHEQISRECFEKWFAIADTIEELQAENEWLTNCHNANIFEKTKLQCEREFFKMEIARLKKQLYTALDDIPHTCAMCVYKDNAGQGRYCAFCVGNLFNGWQWRGEEGKA